MILAFDPSLTCTGYACLLDDCTNDGVLHEAGIIEPDETGTVYERARSIIRQANDIYKRMMTVRDIVVEMPAEHIRSKHTRSLVTLPNYGIIVGGMLFGIRTGPNVSVYAIPVTAWSKHAPKARSPGDEKGAYKIPRVRMCEHLYDLENGALGCKTKAGNVADAILLARHHLQCTRR